MSDLEDQARLQAQLLDDPAAVAEARKILGDRPWPHKLKLGTPVAFGKETIEELVFQKGNLGILKGINVGPVGAMPNYDVLMMIASRLCGQPLKVIELLDPDDAEEVITLAIGFFGRCRGAGKALSG